SRVLTTHGGGLRRRRCRLRYLAREGVLQGEGACALLVESPVPWQRAGVLPRLRAHGIRQQDSSCLGIDMLQEIWFQMHCIEVRNK
ncbi:unnamed protein product, partial [Urochloa humidicola]